MRCVLNENLWRNHRLPLPNDVFKMKNYDATTSGSGPNEHTCISLILSTSSLVWHKAQTAMATRIICWIQIQIYSKHKYKYLCHIPPQEQWLTSRCSLEGAPAKKHNYDYHFSIYIIVIIIIYSYNYQEKYSKAPFQECLYNSK